MSEFLEVLADHVSASSPPQFRKDVLFALSKHIGFDGAIWGEAHITNQMTLHEPEVIGLPADDLTGLQTAAYSDPHMQLVFQKPGSPVAYSVNKHSPKALVEYTEQNGVKHVMSTAQFDQQIGLASGLVLTRNFENSAFSKTEEAFMFAVFPHLIRCWAENQISFVRREIDKEYRNKIFAVVTRFGNITGAEKGFLDKLRIEWPGFSGPQLPDEIGNLISQRTVCSHAGSRIVVKCHPTKDLSLLIVRDRVKADSLTAKQMSVAQLCVDGLTYREIADHLSIAPSTARNHIAAIHERLMVNRNSEIARLLAEMD
ncbi:MAG: helix-turn-helix transcriptional regulator [Pseudomonadota bacterium]